MKSGSHKKQRKKLAEIVDWAECTELINGRLIRVHYCRLGIKRPTTYRTRKRERDTHSKDRYTKKGRREIDRNEMKYVQPMSKTEVE